MPTRRQLANAIRALSMDAVQKANSGHPGMPMGMADIAQVLWRDFLKHNPGNPLWPDRDRFVLSNGHGSMLLYSLLHLTGYPLPLDELKNFRQLGSRTAGHPEHEHQLGIETTTGPLGQGLANAVGMALAEKQARGDLQSARAFEIVDHHTWVFVGDGCLMEGISHEACSLAGTLGLGKLIAFYDDNGISIDGEVRGWFTDDTPKRFEAYGWHVIPGRRRPRRGGGRAARSDAAQRRDGAPVADLLQDHHRLGRAEQAGHRGDARRRARRGRSRARRATSSTGRIAAFRGARGHPRRPGTHAVRRQARREPPGRRCSRRTARHTPTSPRSSSGGSAASCRAAGGSARTSSSRAPSAKPADVATRQLLAAGAQRARRR